MAQPSMKPNLAISYTRSSSAHRARGEGLMDMLLDRGASVHDSVSFIPTYHGTSTQEEQPKFTAFSLAIAGCSYSMVRRLLDAGADIHQRLAYYSSDLGIWDDNLDISDATALHLGSQTWNVEGIRAVLDYFPDKRSNLVLSCDGMGRLPLHYAAVGSDSPFEPYIAESTLVQRITGTFELLVPSDHKAAAEMINSRDKRGGTPLHYAVQAHASCGSQGSKHAFHAIQWLSSRGADASMLNPKKQTVLHMLAHWSLDGERIDLDVIQVLLDHGCPLDTIDESGETALHVFARHLWQGHAARFLIQQGARIDIVKKKGNLPLHEAARGAMRSRKGWDWKGLEPARQGDRVRAQDEVMQALLDVDETPSVLDQPNYEGKTPRQLREETRRK